LEAPGEGQDCVYSEEDEDDADGKSYHSLPPELLLKVTVSHGETSRAVAELDMSQEYRI
jgi:hypothetical protein